MLNKHWQALVYELWPTGLLGLLTPWGFFFFLGVPVVTALTSSAAYSSPTAAFQNMPAMPLIFIGSVMVLVKLASFARPELANNGEIVASPNRTTRTPRKVAAHLAPMLAIVLALTATTVVVVQADILVRRNSQEVVDRQRRSGYGSSGTRCSSFLRTRRS